MRKLEIEKSSRIFEDSAALSHINDKVPCRVLLMEMLLSVGIYFYYHLGLQSGFPFMLFYQATTVYAHGEEIRIIFGFRRIKIGEASLF